ncbi:MAG: leucine-rich repeat domain-containing protein [Lachnospiraceae bacterium]|nr:leucine-rich repeat domain-containing protein [Lachnospiraceae bacterium]
MKIFYITSADAEPHGAYEDFIRRAGHDIAPRDADSLLCSDALFICISGRDNREIKENLNLALDREMPVAYVTEETGEADPGLKIQLAIAAKIPPCGGSEEDAENSLVPEKIKSWLENVSGIKSSRNKKKHIKLAVCLSAIVVVLAVALILILTHMNTDDNDTSKSQLTVEAMLGLDHDEIKEEAYIDLSGTGIEDITFLKDCKACTQLDISGNAISDISVLSNMENIRVLDVSDNNISDINVLLTLKNLEEVDLRNNPIRDYTATSFLDGVKILQ